ncbi:uncharacterized protein AMSG_11453 [Thecamonas trahens ATCC 50062]|uniref:Uncharacterized protein n=1 Tax=Thecamonas trahens ATCC 50062 TaxID=461836 RepID=A0A0L0DV75_THETB|nr:hypothetical protein AMSG_11453 [Thecamonas trahens ATCC 50062]KNC56204.1 hypothetical protein AMSG_11453 [Thecamonas trahens ATCC 50062]|eukprot:XP_013752670.1 hypothetical protein AMSG_11453 [Thecamonas trahens ATCC 50062]
MAKDLGRALRELNEILVVLGKPPMDGPVLPDALDSSSDTTSSTGAGLVGDNHVTATDGPGHADADEAGEDGSGRDDGSVHAVDSLDALVLEEAAAQVARAAVAARKAVASVEPDLAQIVKLYDERAQNAVKVIQLASELQVARIEVEAQAKLKDKAERAAEAEAQLRTRAENEAAELSSRLSEAYTHIKTMEAEKDALQRRVGELSAAMPQNESEREALAEQLAELQGELEEAKQWQPSGIAQSVLSGMWWTAKSAFQLASDGMGQIKNKTRSKPGVYTRYETLQMETIQRYYARHITSELPDILQTLVDDAGLFRAATAPAHIPTTQDYRFAEWSHKIGAGFLAGVARSLVKKVCEYQAERAGRYFGITGCGYVDDPTNLVLRELKDWLVVLSSCDKTERTRLDIDARCAFLDELIDNNVFQSSGRSTTTMTGMLAGVRTELAFVRDHYDDDEALDLEQFELLADAMASDMGASTGSMARSVAASSSGLDLARSSAGVRLPRDVAASAASLSMDPRPPAESHTTNSGGGSNNDDDDDDDFGFQILS